MTQTNSKRQTLTFAPVIFFIICAVALIFIFKSGGKQNISQNENTAVSTLKTLHEALDRYKKDNLFYPSSLTLLASGLLSTKYLENPDIVSEEHPLGPAGMFIYHFSGYWYLYECQPWNSDKITKYTITAFPRKPNKTGIRRFRISQDGALFIQKIEAQDKPPVLIPYTE